MGGVGGPRPWAPTASSRPSGRTHTSAGSRIHGGVFVAGSLAWGMTFDGLRPDRWDIAGSVICLLGVVANMVAPRGAG